MWLLLWSSLAFAQDEGPTAGDTRWVVADVDAARFPDTDAHKLALKAEDQVEVVYVKGDRIRINKEGRYAWVTATALTDEAPEVDVSDSALLDNPALTTPIQIPGLDLQLGGSN